MAKKKIEKQEDLLTDASDDLIIRHNAFIEYYLESFNGTMAWMETHPGVDKSVASASSSRLLRNVRIKAELERRFKERTIGKNEIIDRLKAIANATLFPFIKVDGDGHTYFNFKDPEAKKHLYLVRKLKSKKTERTNRDGYTEEKWIEVELHDAMKALELLGKYHAMFTDKTEITDRKIIHVTVKKEE